MEIQAAVSFGHVRIKLARSAHRLICFILSCALLAGIFAVGSSCARADGDDFFFDDNGVPRDTDLFFVGSVKDENGRFISRARVRAVLTLNMDSGVRHLTYESITNELGRYRTLNLANVILGLDLELDPSLVTLSVLKEGYREKYRDNRSRRGQTRLIEINFVMSRAPEAGDSKKPSVKLEE